MIEDVFELLYPLQPGQRDRTLFSQKLLCVLLAGIVAFAVLGR